MADDITLNPGTGGSIVSTEQLTTGGDSSHAQRIKLITGAAHVDGGDVTPSNGLPCARVDNAGNVLGTTSHPDAVQGSGTAGTPAGGVLTVQGVTSGTPVAVLPGDGTRSVTVKAASTAAQATDTALVVAISPNNSITASNPSVSATAAAVPADATMIGGPDGSGNLRAPVVKATDGTSADEGMVVRPVQGTAANLAATVTQGPAASAAGAWPVLPGDGTHSVTVKAASTGPAAADTALVVAQSPSSGATLSNVAGATSGTQLLAANTARKGALIYNDSSAIMYLALQAAGSTTTSSYTTQVPSQGLYKLDFLYQGIISAVWASATGNARITELT